MDTRERLLEAAITLLARDGYARTTTRAIVAEAAASLPAVNYFFGSKDALLREAVVEALRRWAQSTMVATDEQPQGGAGTQLGENLDRFYSTLGADRSYIVAAMEAFAQAERDEELRAKLADAYGDFHTQVLASIERQQRGASETPDGKALATVLIALFDGLALQWLLDPEGAMGAEDVMRGLRALTTVLSSEG